VHKKKLSEYVNCGDSKIDLRDTKRPEHLLRFNAILHRRLYTIACNITYDVQVKVSSPCNRPRRPRGGVEV
jgi:hypothetical protein